MMTVHNIIKHFDKLDEIFQTNMWILTNSNSA